MIEKNNLDIPEYLDEEFFKAALQNGLNTKNIKIKEISFSMGSAPGDNYASIIYRAIVTYNINNGKTIVVPLIIKSVPKGGHRDILDDLNSHGKEVAMFVEVLPKMESILFNTKLAPKCYYAIDEPLNTLVFNDLREAGFTLADREKGLDEVHCKMVLERLGKFHAASMLLGKKEPSIMKTFKHSFFVPEVMDSTAMKSFFIDSLLITVDIVQKWSGYEKYAAKMKIIHGNLVERLLAIGQPTEDEIKVLNHGDLWVNNFMFQYKKDDEKNPIDVSFFDYQGSFYSSPGLDVNYFLNTSIQFDVLKNRRDFMVEEYYYKSLRRTLEQIEYEQVPSFDDIKKEIRRKEFFGFISAVGVLPIICMDRKDSTDNSLEAILDKETGNNKQQIARQSKRFEQVMKYMLKRADDLGVLD